MKFLKLIALMMVLAMVLTFGVACNSGDGAETTGGSGDAGTTAGGDGATTEAPFVTELTIIGLDDKGEKVYLIEKEDAQYNGLKPTTELTMFDVISDYCADNDVECVLDSDTGRLISVDVYTTAEGGYVWSYELNGEKITDDYNRIIASGAEIVVTLAPLE